MKQGFGVSILLGKADIYFACPGGRQVGKEELQTWAIKNKQQIDFAGITVDVAPPEYVIIKKMMFYKEGKAQKHLTDIQGILANSKNIINFTMLHDMINRMGLNDVWDAIEKDIQ